MSRFLVTAEALVETIEEAKAVLSAMEDAAARLGQLNAGYITDTEGEDDGEQRVAANGRFPA